MRRFLVGVTCAFSVLAGGVLLLVAGWLFCNNLAGGAPPSSSPPERVPDPPPDAAPGLKLSAESLKAIKAYGDPTQLKDAAFTQVKGKKLVQRLIISDFLKTELNLGQQTGHLKRLPEGELLAVQNSISGYYAKDDRPAWFFPYDEDKGVQDPVLLEPEAGSTSAFVPGNVGYILVLPKKKK